MDEAPHLQEKAAGFLRETDLEESEGLSSKGKREI